MKALQAMGLILGSFALCVLILDLTIRGFGLFEKERAAVATPPEPVAQHEEQPQQVIALVQAIIRFSPPASITGSAWYLPPPEYQH